jgi:hypothetical protein
VHGKSKNLLFAIIFLKSLLIMMFSPIFPWKAKALTETCTNKQIEINRIFLSRRHPIRFYAECPGTLGIATGSTVPATRQAFYLLAEAPFSRLLAMQDTYIAAALLSILSFAGCLFVKAGKKRGQA